MDGDRKVEAEFTVERGGEKDRSAKSSSPHRASSGRPSQGQSGQAEFDLDGSGQRQPESGMPDRLRRKYYVAEAGAGDEAKVYADQRGEYLAFKVSAERMATRLEDAGVVRDMVSIAQHRGWKDVELRGSEEFRRTAWLEASVRGLAVRGYEPDPVDRAALSFRTKAEERSSGAPSRSRRPEPEASETIFVAGVSTRRPIEATVLPPEPGAKTRGQREDGPASFQGPIGSGRVSSWNARISGQFPPDRSGMTIHVVPLRSETSPQSSRNAGQRRADLFLSGDHRQKGGYDVVKAARSQLAAIEKALSKAIRDTELRCSVLAHAKERIAEQLERGGAFKYAELREETRHRRASPEGKSDPKRQNRSNATEVHRER